MTATVTTKYNCGCGYHTTTLSDAVKHAEAYGHQMSVLGVVQVPKAPAIQSPRVQQVQTQEVSR